MLACLTAVCLLPGRAEAGGSQSDGQTGPQGGSAISDGARVLYFKKERDE